jgi:hypothetical protein
MQREVERVAIRAGNFQERAERIGQRNHALLVVFRAPLAFTLSQPFADAALDVDDPCQLEPICSRLADLAAAQSGIESAEQDEAQIVIRRGRDQRFFSRLVHEAFPAMCSARISTFATGLSSRARRTSPPSGRTSSASSCNLQRSNRSRARAAIVKASRTGSGHIGRRRSRPADALQARSGSALRLGRIARVFAALCL